MMRCFLPVAFVLLGCGSAPTIEIPFIEADAGQDAPLVCDYDRTAARAPCSTDAECKVTACEYGRCDPSMGFCVVNDGAPDGAPCESGGACKDWICCH